MKFLSKISSAWLIGGLLLLAVLLMVAGKVATNKPLVTVADPSGLSGIQMTEAPWVAEIGGLRARLNAIGLSSLTGMTEGDALHIHQHLDILIHGKPVVIPANIGINQLAGFISPIHVHDTTGIIHVESPKVVTFTLGQFFDVWGVRFTDSCIGGYCANAENTLSVYVNGALYSGDPRTLELAQHDKLVIVYGTADEVPHPIPSSYVFPAGY